VLSNDHGTVLRNSVAWAHGGEQPLNVTGKGLIDVSLWQQKDSVTAHLVNLTNPMTMKGPIRETIPSPPQKVRLRMPAGKRAKSVHLLVSGVRPRYTVRGSVVEVDVPSIDLHEVVAIDVT
jgi:hypothetical protein